MTSRRVLRCVALALVLAACTSEPMPEAKETSFIYRHTRAFLESEALLVLAKDWPKPAPEKERPAILTEWKVALAPFSEKGRRDRLRVFVETATGGFKVRCEQETELNAEQEDPLSLEKADWSPVSSNGAAASKFLFDLHRRIEPKETWREADIR